jgi:hypothetical protein
MERMKIVSWIMVRCIDVIIGEVKTEKNAARRSRWTSPSFALSFVFCHRVLTPFCYNY